MLCTNLKGRTRACGPVTGGVSDVGIFDPNDFNFTQAAPVSGVVQPYTAAVLRAGATSAAGAKVYLLSFQQDEGTSGKVFDDFNGGNIHLKGSYGRNLYEWTGTWADIEALT
jgi:hypothetical protein